MTNEIKNVPELRFPEFKEEWVEKKLGEITSKISDGIHSTPTYDSNGDIYFINGNNLVNGRIDFKTSKKISVQEFNKYKNYLEAKNTLLLSINGTIGNIAKYEGENILLGKSAAYINVVSKFISRCYIFYYLQTSKIYESFLRELTGTTIKNLSLKSIKNIIVYISELDEQQKIGEFFSKLDRQIELEEQKLEKLEEQKKGYMQKIFSQELRFKNDKENNYPEWEVKQLKEILEFSNKRTTKENEYPILTSSRKGLILQSDYYKEGKTFADSNVGYFILPKNFITYRSRSDDGIFKFNLNQIIDTGIISKYYPVFKGINSNQYYLALHLNNQLKKEYIKYATGTSQLVLSHKNLQEIKTKLPFYDEQTKIADFLIKFDELIEKQNQKIDGLKSRKKGFLQKMFV